MKFILILIGGGLGALSRYGISIMAARAFGERFPVGTLTVNLLGCFLIGLGFSLGNIKNVLPPEARIFLMTGFLGALTTFSTYGLESVTFAKNGMMGVSLLNIALNNIGGLIMVIIGLWIGKIL